LAFLLAGWGCTKVVRQPPPPPPGGVGGAGGGPAPVIAHVQLLTLFNLPLSAVNLTPGYAEVHDALIAALLQAGIVVDATGVAPQYGAPGLLWGQSDRVQPQLDLLTVLRSSANSGRYELGAGGPEQRNLAALGGSLGALTVPPSLLGGASIPLYDTPRDGIVVATVHSTRRACALSDDACRLGGLSPVEFFTSARGNGTASWIAPPQGAPGFPLPRVAFVDIFTSEGEAPDQFRARCAAIPGFSRTLLDDMEPSPVVYYAGFQDEVGARGPIAESVDLCEALGDAGHALLERTAGAIAAGFAHH
jgi:hypothetical protein